MDENPYLPEDLAALDGHAAQDASFDAGAYDDVAPFAVAWPMQFAQTVYSESESSR